MVFRFRVPKRCVVQQCSKLFYATLKNPNHCDECFVKYVVPQRKKAGLAATPAINVENAIKKEKAKRDFLEWYREQMKDADFGQRLKLRRKLDEFEREMRNTGKKGN